VLAASSVLDFYGQAIPFHSIPSKDTYIGARMNEYNDTCTYPFIVTYIHTFIISLLILILILFEPWPSRVVLVAASCRPGKHRRQTHALTTSV
jgi:hypothetical protein